MASESVNFALILQDQMSKPLFNIGKTGKDAFDRMEHEAEGFNNAVRRSQKETQGLSGIMTSLRSSALSLLGAYAGFQTFKGFLNIGMDAEQTNVSITTMLGSVEKAKELIADVNSFANVTPFTNSDLFEQTKLLLNFNVAQEKMIPTLKMLGDVSQGNKEKFSSLALAYGQVQSQGKLTGQDLMQLINAGFNPLNELSKLTGRSMQELKEDMSKGAISSDMLTAAFISATSEGGMFHNMLEKGANTAWGKLSTMMGKAMYLGENLYKAIEPAVHMVLDLGVAFFSSDEALTTFGTSLGLAIGAFAAYKTGVFLSSLATKGFSFSLRGVGMAIRSIPIVGWAAAGLEVLFLLYQHSETFRGSVLGIWEVMKSMGSMFTGLFTDFSGTLGKIGDSIAGFFKKQIAPVFEIIEAVRNKDWLGAAKAGGKLLFNFSGAGMVWNAGEATVNSGAFQRGAAKAKDGGGKISLFDMLGVEKGGENKKHEGFSKEDMLKLLTGENNKLLTDNQNLTDHNRISNTYGKVSGSGSGRPLTIHIGKLFEDQVINVSGDLKDNYNQVREQVNRALTDAVRDFELSYE
jgi:tape measure domain-containing protein